MMARGDVERVREERRVIDALARIVAGERGVELCGVPITRAVFADERERQVVADQLDFQRRVCDLEIVVAEREVA